MHSNLDLSLFMFCVDTNYSKYKSFQFLAAKLNSHFLWNIPMVGGTIAMVGIYFLGEYFGGGVGWGGPAQALAEWPFNLLQNIGGAIVAIPLSEVIRRAYPPLMRYTEQ